MPREKRGRREAERQSTEVRPPTTEVRSRGSEAPKSEAEEKERLRRGKGKEAAAERERD